MTWNGHFWYLVYRRDKKKYQIVRDDNRRLLGYRRSKTVTPGALPRYYSNGFPFTVHATASSRADLETLLELFS